MNEKTAIPLIEMGRQIYKLTITAEYNAYQKAQLGMERAEVVQGIV